MSQVLMFSVDENEIPVSIEITDDDMLESNESFAVIILSDDGLMLANVTVIIKDNDGMWTVYLVMLHYCPLFSGTPLNNHP